MASYLIAWRAEVTELRDDDDDNDIAVHRIIDRFAFCIYGRVHLRKTFRSVVRRRDVDGRIDRLRRGVSSPLFRRTTCVMSAMVLYHVCRYCFTFPTKSFMSG